MSAKTVAIGCDHAGLEMKTMLMEKLRADGHQIIDVGTYNSESVDYPDFGIAVAKKISAGEAEMGVLVCGTGIGISMAANRFGKVRCAVCTSALMARLARQHNDANVLALGARIIGPETALDCLDTFMTTDFEGGRHARRVGKLSQAVEQYS